MSQNDADAKPTETDHEDGDGSGGDESGVSGRNWRRFARTWGSRLGLVLLVLIVVPFVVYAVPQVVGADHSYVVLSGSMEPAISTGDAVVVDSVDPSQIEVGDVITFASSADERPTTHRVIGVNDGDGGLAFETKGDNNEDPDPSTVPAEDVQGTVVSFGGFLSIPLIGWVINFTGTQVGFLALFVVPITLFVLNEVWNVVSASSAAADSEADRTGDGDSSEGSASADSSEDGSANEETQGTDAQVTFTASELELGLAILGAFTAYSLWIAYATMEVWSFGVAGSTVVALLLLGGIYLRGKVGTTSNESIDEVNTSSTVESGGSSPSTASPEGDDD